MDERHFPADVEVFEAGAVHGDMPLTTFTQALVIRRNGRVLVCANYGAGPTCALDVGEQENAPPRGAVAMRGDPHQVHAVQPDGRAVRLDIYRSAGCGCGSPLRTYQP